MKHLFDTLDRIENLTLVWTILGLAFIGFVQVITRYVFNYSFTWFEELGQYLGIFVAFLGASLWVKTGSHFTMDLMISHLRHPWQQLTRTLTAGLSAGFFFTVTWYSWRLVLRMHGYEAHLPHHGDPHVHCLPAHPCLFRLHRNEIHDQGHWFFQICFAPPRHPGGDIYDTNHLH